MDTGRKAIRRKYKTFESETLIFISTSYAVVSLILVTIVFRFWLPENYKFPIVGAYALFSLSTLIWMGFQSRRRTELNKLPSLDVLELCYLVKETSDQSREGYSGCWHVTYELFNTLSMERLFGDMVSQIVPPHDYFSYMLAEKYIEIQAIIDKGCDINKNSLSICLSDKALSRLAIYEKSGSW